VRGESFTILGKFWQSVYKNHVGGCGGASKGENRRSRIYKGAKRFIGLQAMCPLIMDVG